MKKTIFKTTLFFVCLAWLSPAFSQNQLVGTVNYHNDPGTPVPEVTIDLYDMNNTLMASTITNDYGEYEFDSIPNGSYYLVSATMLSPGQVTLQDAFLIMMHLFGVYDFTEYEFAAADVDGSGTITWSDYFIVLINYILQGQPFPVGEWQFENVQIDFNARTMGSSDTATVWATGSGDLDGNWLPTGRSISLVPSITSESVTMNNEISKIPVTSSYSSLISGFNLNIHYPSEMMIITGVEGPDGNLNYAIQDGMIKIIWMDESKNPGSHVYGDHLCNLLVNQKINASNHSSATMSIDDQGMILDANGLAIDGVEIQLPEIKISGSDTKIGATAYPNPVCNQLNILIESEDQPGLLLVFDLNGKLIRQTKLDLSTGEHQILTLETSELIPGSYNYFIKSESSNQTIASGRFFKSN
jgi:hypothetical protein